MSERLSKPNIFILNNRWDASDMAEIEEEEELEGKEESVDGIGIPNGSKMMEQVFVCLALWSVFILFLPSLPSFLPSSLPPGKAAAHGEGCKIFS